MPKVKTKKKIVMAPRPPRPLKKKKKAEVKKAMAPRPPRKPPTKKA